MYDAEGGGGYFEGIEEPFRKMKVADLAGIIQKHGPQPLWISLNWKSFNSIVRSKVLPDLDSPYAILYYQILRLAYEWQEARHAATGHPIEKIYFSFDVQGIEGLNAERWYEGLKERMPEPFRQMMTGPPVFEDDEQVLPLQAADMLAWHVRNELEHPEKKREICEVISARGMYRDPIGDDLLHDYVRMVNALNAPATYEEIQRRKREIMKLE